MVERWERKWRGYLTYLKPFWIILLAPWLLLGPALISRESAVLGNSSVTICSLVDICLG